MTELNDSQVSLQSQSNHPDHDPERPQFWHAVLEFLCAVTCGLCVNALVYVEWGPENALMWFNGFFLEWALSVDNLFVFYGLFSQFKTPYRQRHTALFYGIWGAIIMRMSFFLIGGTLYKHLDWLKYVLGILLIITAFKTGFSEDNDDDETQFKTDGWFFKMVERFIPIFPGYTKNGNFLIDEHDIPSQALHPRRTSISKSIHQIHLKEKLSQSQQSHLASSQLTHISNISPAPLSISHTPPKKTYATMLLIVVLSLEAIDLLFAIDSTTAIIATIPDIYIAISSTIMALFGLRAAYFVIDSIVQFFTFLKYGLALLLAFIGTKLLIHSYVEIPNSVMSLVMISVIGLSIIISILYEFLYIPLMERGSKGVESVVHNYTAVEKET